jgi:hypothetical protein
VGRFRSLRGWDVSGVRVDLLPDVPRVDKRELRHHQPVPITCPRRGHLLFLAIEKLKGGPVSERVQDFSYRIGSILLVLLMGLALFNDFSRL